MRIALTGSAAALLIGLLLRLFGIGLGSTIVAVGLVALTMLPPAALLRVLITAVLRREWRFVIVTLAVVALLGLTLLWRV
jgi:hypothetical protein